MVGDGLPYSPLFFGFLLFLLFVFFMFYFSFDSL
jgi:hypothetical protein